MDEEMIDRNFGTRPGRDLRDDVDLADWDERSVWGYDEGVGSFYAQLWRNPGDSDEPDVWLSGVDPHYPWPGCIALAIVETTGCDPVSVVRALGLANPHPALRPLADIARQATPLTSPAGDGYTTGRVAVLNWILGAAREAPGSRLPWRADQRPTPEEVTAEQHMVTGRVYQSFDPYTRAWLGGADEALAWALGDD